MALDLYKYVASVPDYPEKGVIFRDILPLMADGAAFKQATDELVDYAKDKKGRYGSRTRSARLYCWVSYCS